MLNIALVMAFALAPPPPIDTAAVYSALLRDLHATYPTRQIVVDDRRSRVECIPHCPDSAPDERHAPALLQSLRVGDAAPAICHSPPDMLGCRGFPRHMYIALGDVRTNTPPGGLNIEGGVWVMMVSALPCDCRSPDASGIRYLLRRDRHGVWQIIDHRMEWTV